MILQDKPAKTDFETSSNRPNTLRARDRRWIDLWNKGGGTVSDCIVADYGTYVPNGLDIPVRDESPMIFDSQTNAPGFDERTLLEKANGVKFMGCVYWAKPDTIYLNPIFNLLSGRTWFPGRQRAATMMSHEFLHTRQGAESKAGHFSFQRYKLFPEPKDFKLKTHRFCVEAKSRLSSFFKYKVDDYLADSVEMQARLHEILPQGYVDWGKLPTTRTELQAALYHLGFKIPDSVYENLQVTEAGQKALDNFKVGHSVKKAVARTVGLMNTVYDFAGTTELQEKLWESTYPVDYAYILEFYGDKLGRERMEFGKNPRHVDIDCQIT